MLPQPSIPTLQCIICTCTKARNFSLALSVYFHFYNTGLQAHASLGNSLLAMLGEVGSMPNALRVFHALPADDKARWDHLINGYLKRGEDRPALLVYQKMHEECTFPPTSHTLVALLKACTKLKDLKIGQLIHHQIIQFQNLDVYNGGALVEFYGKCGCLTKAREVFDSLSVLNGVIWNILIGVYVVHDRCKEALNAFEEMQAKGLCPNAVTYVLILNSCRNTNAKERHMLLHRLITTEGLMSNMHVCSALISTFVDCGMLEIAQDLFERLCRKDVGTWNALIAGYAKHELSQEAVHLFYRMRQEGVPPNNVTFASVLTACTSIGAIDTTTKLCYEIERRGLHKSNVFVGSGLVHMYAKWGVLAKAQNMIDHLPVRGVVTWNALIAGYANESHSEEALNCFEQMNLEGVLPNLVTYTCILKACGATGRVEKGIEIHEELARKGLQGENLFLGSALVAMYAKCGDMTKSQDVFDMLPVRNVVTWSSLISGYAQCGRVEKVLLMFRTMVNEGQKPDQPAFACVLTACSHAGLVETAKTYYEEVSGSYGVPPCFGHHTCVIDVFGRAGQIQNATEIMKKAPFLPNLVAFSSLLSSCQKQGDVEQGRRAFQQAVCLNETVEGTYVCMNNMYAVTNIV